MAFKLPFGRDSGTVAEPVEEAVQLVEVVTVDECSADVVGVPTGGWSVGLSDSDDAGLSPESETSSPSSNGNGPDPKVGKGMPTVGAVTKLRRVVDNTFEDYSGKRFSVWEIVGCDHANMHVVNGWGRFLNSLDYPVQLLVRQHVPDYSEVRQSFIDARPEWMQEGRINDVCDSLLDYLTELEQPGRRVVDRRWYVICDEAKTMEMDTLLMQCGFDFMHLQDDQLSMLLQACSSGMGYGHQQEVYQVKVNSKDVEFNRRYMTSYEVTKWPRNSSLMFLENLLRTGEEMDISIWIWPVSGRESHTQLEMKKARFIGNQLTCLQKGKMVPPEVELAIEDITRIAEEVNRGVARLFRRTMVVSLYASERAYLKTSAEQLIGHFRSSLAQVRPLNLRQEVGLWCVMPALRKAPGEPDLTDTGTMQRLFPFGPPDLDKREGFLFGMDLRSRSPVIYNPFSPAAMNGHMVVMARSGAGKSFFTKLRVVRISQQNVPVYLIDPEGEYGVITRELGGDVYVPGAPGYGLNPFVVGYLDRSDLARRIQGIKTLIGVMLEGHVDNDLNAVIDRCLVAYYTKEYLALSSQGNRNPTLGQGGMADFNEFLNSAEAREMKGPVLSHLLSSFATGSARFLLENSSKELMTNEAPVTSFNLKHLNGALKPVAISICAEVVWGLAVAKPRPRMLVVDECWTVLATPSGAEALITIVKRARKYQLALMAITQDVQDFLSENKEGGAITGHAGRSLLQNSATKLALSQDPGALPQVVEALGLNQDAAAFLSGAMRGQGLLIGETGNVFPVEIVSTAKERELVLDDAWRQDGELSQEEDVVLQDEGFDDLMVLGNLQEHLLKHVQAADGAHDESQLVCTVS